MKVKIIYWIKMDELNILLDVEQGLITGSTWRYDVEAIFFRSSSHRYSVILF